MAGVLLWTAFTLGLAGSLHCIGMCGPLAMALPGVRSSGLRPWAARLVYHSGRIVTYMVIGLVFGAVGHLLSLVVYQQTLSIATGGIMLAGLILPRLRIGPRALFLRRWTNAVSNALGKLRLWKGAKAPFIFGMLNGALPCGVVYFAAAASIAQGSMEYSVLYMLLFGLGTLPVMIGLSWIPSLLSAAGRLRLHHSATVFSLCLAFILLLRGMGLGIPYLSPDIKLPGNGKVHSCCVKQP